MYYTVIEKRNTGIVYTGVNGKREEGLLEKAQALLPQYLNLQTIEVEGEMPEEECFLIF